MANAKTHALIAGIAGVGTYALYCRRNRREVRFWGAVGSGLLSAFGGLVPDLIEPAVDPNHRRFFHSVVTGADLACGAVKAQGDQSFSDTLELVTVLLVVGYISHLLADALTPKGLPFVC